MSNARDDVIRPEGYMPGLTGDASWPLKCRFALGFPEGDVWPLVILLANWKTIVTDYLKHLETRKTRAAADFDELSRKQIEDWIDLTAHLLRSSDLPIDSPSMRVQLATIAAHMKDGLAFEAQLLGRKRDPGSVIERRVTWYIWGLDQVRILFNARFVSDPPFGTSDETFDSFIPSLGAAAARKRLERFVVPADEAARALALVLNSMCRGPFGLDTIKAFVDAENRLNPHPDAFAQKHP